MSLGKFEYMLIQEIQVKVLSWDKLDPFANVAIENAVCPKLVTVN